MDLQRRSWKNFQGLTYIEAAANGLPLVCRKDSCLEDVIKEGVNGYEYSSPREFFKAIRKVLEDDKWRKEAGKYSEEIAGGFDKRRFAENVERVYKKVLRKKELKRAKIQQCFCRFLLKIEIQQFLPIWTGILY